MEVCHERKTYAVRTDGFKRGELYRGGQKAVCVPVSYTHLDVYKRQKLASPKNLLVSLLGCAFAVLKIVTFDGIVDLFWILFIGYLSVKCLAAGLSQEAYDKDIKQAQQAKVLYRDLFGKFAYVAADIPILLLLFTGLLAVICPITAFFRAALITLFLAAAGYAVWLCWYISKHKRQRMFKGEWGTGGLSPEEEKAWKRSGLWHGILLGISAVFCAFYFIFGNSWIS